MRAHHTTGEESVAPNALGMRQSGLGTTRPRLSERLVLPLILSAAFMVVLNSNYYQ